MTSRLLAITLSLCIGLLVGCSEQDIAENEAPHASATKEPWLTTLIGRPDGMEPAGKWEDPLEIQRELKLLNGENMAIFRAAVAKPDRWEEADRAIRALLAEESELPQYQREQIAAQVMLRQWFLEGETTAEEQEALGYYTALLVDNNNPQARMIEDALVRLEGYWDDERIALAAAKSAGAAKAHLAKQSGAEQIPPVNDVLRAHAMHQQQQASEIDASAQNLEDKAKQ